MAEGKSPITRRGLLIGGGVGVGLLVGWVAWPRDYSSNLVAAPGEHILNAFVKVGVDGHVAVAVPQVEMGQGVYTTLPQIVADELGADWRTIGVEAAPLNPLYANRLFVEEWLEGRRPAWLADRIAVTEALMITGGSTSVRGFEDRLREAGAAARVLLCRAAAARWDADWRACDTADGFVTRGDDRLHFGDLAAEAASYRLPRDIPRRSSRENRLTGRSLPRLDLPSKVDGSVNYAGDVRLPDMVFASIAQGPLGDGRLVSIDEAAARPVPGVVEIVRTDRWVAAVATNWWAADRAVQALRPRFATAGALAGDRAITRALDAAFENGARVASQGDVGASFRAADVYTAEYRAGLAPHAAIETLAATASIEHGVLQLWIGTQAQGLAVEAASRATGIPAKRIVVHPMMIGGSFGRRYEVEIAGQAALIAQRINRPVQLVWSRAEDMRQDRFRPAAAARMTARLGPGGRIDGWLARIATPATARELERRLWWGDDAHSAMRAAADLSDGAAVAGAVPPYAIPNYAVDHHPAAIGVPTGDWRGRAHGLSAFFTECFIDELAGAAGLEPFSYRMAMLGDNPRLAFCLSKAAALGSWQGAAGAGQGLACHSFAGSHIAVMAEAAMGGDGRVHVSRLVAVADCGRIINPDIVRQQIAGGLLFGMSSATGAAVRVAHGIAGPDRFGDLALPRMADAPRIEIELIPSPHPPGGVGELAVPPAAPAIVNALWSGGKRLRALPVIAG